MRPLAVAVVVTACSCATSSCSAGGGDLDLTPPRVLVVEPAKPVLQTTDPLAVQFSEPMNPDTITAETIVIAPTVLVTEAFITDLNSPPLLDSRLDDVVPLTVELDAARERVTIVPTAALDARTAYTLLVSDGARDAIGNPLFNEAGQKSAFRFDFTTDDGPPQIASHDVVSADRPLVAPNRRRFTIVFDQPMRGLDRASLTVVGRGAAASITPSVEAVLVDEARTTATLLLEAVDGCFRLSPDAAYAIELGHGITDDEGQDLAATAIELTTGPACDPTANAIVGQPFPIGGETTATIRFETTKPSTTAVRFGLPGAPLDCAGAPCPAIGAPALVPDPEAATPRFVHAVEITGLAVNETYAFRVFAEDDVGTIATADGFVRTAPLARVSINEVMAKPPAAVTNESAGEYVELANYGEEPVDVSGWMLAVDGGDAAGGDTCALPAAVPPIEAGGFALLVGTAFDPSVYGDVPAPLVTMATSTVCGQLTNSRAQSFVLFDGDGRPVSSVSAYPALAPDDDGQSLERTAPAEPDVEASFCFSRDDVGPTPGAVNGVTVNGCAT